MRALKKVFGIPVPLPLSPADDIDSVLCFSACPQGYAQATAAFFGGGNAIGNIYTVALFLWCFQAGSIFDLFL